MISIKLSRRHPGDCPQSRLGKGYLNRGLPYRELKEYDKALADIDQALKMHKGLAPALQSLQNLRSDGSADMEKAKLGFVIKSDAARRR
ncbi:MAG: tetratricopeptide repeat protein [Cyanobacteriota/Melainabacteria group bacterium]